MFPFTNLCHKCGKDIPQGVVFHWVRSDENPDVQTECAECFKIEKQKIWDEEISKYPNTKMMSRDEIRIKFPDNSKNPLFKEATAIWDNVVIHETERPEASKLTPSMLEALKIYAKTPMAGVKILSVEEGRYTFPEDPDTKAGWGPFNFDWLLKPLLTSFVKWHDRVTTKGSFAQKIGIPVWRITQAGKDILNVLCKDKPWYQQAVCRATDIITSETNPMFYEGRLGKDDEFNPENKND